MIFAWVRHWVVAAAVAVAFVSGSLVHANEYLVDTPPLFDRLTPEIVAAVFPDADRIERIDDGRVPAVSAYRGDEHVGFIFSTLDVVRAPGYTITPFDIVAGVDLDGRITGAVNLFHTEPHIRNDERRTELLTDFLGAMAGVELQRGSYQGPKPSFIAGATISARAMRAAIRDSAWIILRNRGGMRVVTEPTLDTDTFQPLTIAEMLEGGLLTSVTITNADLAAAMERAGAAGMTPEIQPQGGPNDVYLELQAGLATAAMIGRNSLSNAHFEGLTASSPQGTHGILLGSNGRYDHQGFKYQNASSGYRLERLRIVQGDRAYEVDRSTYRRIGWSALGRVTGIASVTESAGFDPLSPWRAEILVHASAADGRTVIVPLPALEYRLPASLILLPEPEPLPAWMEAWRESRAEVTVLGAALVVLTLILAFQSVLTRNRVAHRWVRNGFLLFTLGWLGWIVGGQLSIVNLTNYLQGPLQGVGIGFYLAEPLIVMITLYTVASLLMLGRGVFCGWLCPFGALQELLANIARWLRLPQWNPSERWQSKLWLGKYASLAAVLGLVFFVPTAGALAEEVEPFKTAITSGFTRAWPYVLYAGVILSVGLFTERAFCRFLCPLGGALAILDRLHLVNLLKRRPECGSPCQLCERSCPVKAIQVSGKIKMSECFQCLDCQVEYHDDRRCPPLAAARKLGQRETTPPTLTPIPVAARAALPA